MVDTLSAENPEEQQTAEVEDKSPGPMNKVHVRLRLPGRVFAFQCDDPTVKRGDWCIVRTERGLELGQAMSPCGPCPAGKECQPGMRFVRKASEKDLKQHRENLKLESEAFEICARKISEREIPMKLVSVEYTFDASKVVFYFSAENRVDFRELVKDLAYHFKTRIELRQIGVRDDARFTGGIGGCGRVLCCASFLRKFRSVSIKMAKKQNLALNPTKISGVCGRLMCCIQYEESQYPIESKPVTKEKLGLSELEAPELVAELEDELTEEPVEVEPLPPPAPASKPAQQPSPPRGEGRQQQKPPGSKSRRRRGRGRRRSRHAGGEKKQDQK